MSDGSFKIFFLPIEIICLICKNLILSDIKNLLRTNKFLFQNRKFIIDTSYTQTIKSKQIDLIESYDKLPILVQRIIDDLYPSLLMLDIFMI